MADLQAGSEIPEVRVTPDKYLTARYAGASGDFNPIHIDEEFARAVGLPGRILHGLWTMAQVARAQTEAAGGPEHLKRLSVQFRGMGVPEQEVVVTGTVRERERRARASSTRSPSRRASRSSATPRPSFELVRVARRPGAVGDATYNQGHARPERPPGADPVQGGRGLPAHRSAGGVEVDRRRPGARLPCLDGPQRAGAARGARPARPSARLGRAACRPMPGSATWSIGCSPPGRPGARPRARRDWSCR